MRIESALFCYRCNVIAFYISGIGNNSRRICPVCNDELYYIPEIDRTEMSYYSFKTLVEHPLAPFVHSVMRKDVSLLLMLSDELNNNDFEYYCILDKQIE